MVFPIFVRPFKLNIPEANVLRAQIINTKFKILGSELDCVFGINAPSRTTLHVTTNGKNGNRSWRPGRPASCMRRAPTLQIGKLRSVRTVKYNT